MSWQVSTPAQGRQAPTAAVAQLETARNQIGEHVPPEQLSGDLIQVQTRGSDHRLVQCSAAQPHQCR
jgi:hypothetical protein